LGISEVSGSKAKLKEYNDGLIAFARHSLLTEIDWYISQLTTLHRNGDEFIRKNELKHFLQEQMDKYEPLIPEHYYES
jgi:hypothetical protein